MVSGERRPTLPCLVVCPPGLEDVVTAELDDLGTVSYTHLTLPTIYSV